VLCCLTPTKVRPAISLLANKPDRGDSHCGLASKPSVRWGWRQSINERFTKYRRSLPYRSIQFTNAEII
jgi:hypothetical protein